MRKYGSLQSAARVLASNKFVWFIVLLFGVQAAWIALTGRYPQAFDEQTHFGVTQLYANQWSPFFAHQPANAGMYGDVVRNPSFLYYYLLSFPYRVIRLFVDNQISQIILLRFINVGLAVSGLLVFRKFLLELGLSRAKSNLLLFMVSLLPFFVLLAGQISYDNLQFLFAAYAFLLAARLYKDHLKNGSLNWLQLIWLFLVGFLACSVKYTFLPLLVGFGLAFLPAMWRTRRIALSNFKHNFGKLKLSLKVGFITVSAVALFLFAGGVGLNLVRYHNPDPRCDKVISELECDQFGPWHRDYGGGVVTHHPTGGAIASYPFDWFKYMVNESFFAIYSYFDGNNVVIYNVEPAIAQLLAVGWFWTVVCLAVMVISWRKLWRNGLTRMVLTASLLYVAALLFNNLKSFWHSGYPVAIHGRYLLPVLLPLLGSVVIGLDSTLRTRSAHIRHSVRHFMAASVLVSLLLLLTQGGGMATYIVRSSDASFWQESSAAQQVNQDIKTAIDPVILFN